MKPRFSPSCDHSFVKIADNKLSDWMIKQLLNSVIASDSSVSCRSIICLSWIDLLATDKSRYFGQPRPTILLLIACKYALLIQALKWAGEGSVRWGSLDTNGTVLSTNGSGVAYQVVHWYGSYVFTLICTLRCYTNQTREKKSLPPNTYPTMFL